ncbi:hypothetical protein [Acidithiobacillus ferriphilus]|uniref:hypothetical protein n=1 Tax=Acidithiobacillus ferriphilus TaxID=1689834 RepID=UPI002DBE8441|nr:hypothetical protein [Acidithiobacillus ferriphilus]MEB8476317.1 hypothetical protein [Acidithiobacillus ferriphilus]
MKSDKLLDVLRQKFDAPNNHILAQRLGVSPALLSSWSSNPRELNPMQVANLIVKSKKHGMQEARHYSIKPIVEYFPIEANDSRQGAAWEIFDSDQSANKRHEGIKSFLREKKGIYIFYDSRGEALYVGKAKEQSLWDEIKSAFNRDRDTQKIRIASHPTTGTGFRPAYESPRQIKTTKVRLVDLAYYFSAYEVAEDMINNVEALLVRAYSNGLLNARIENFTRKA